MYVCFRPQGEVDISHWIPELRSALGTDHRLAIWPECEDPDKVDGLISWRLIGGDDTTFPNLKFFHSLSAGMDHVINHPARRHDLRLIRMVEPGMRKAMAEYVTAYVMRLHRNMDNNDIYLGKSKWGMYVPALAQDRRIGILGFGELGRACAKTLYQLGFDVAVWGRSKRGVDYAVSYAGEADFTPFLNRSDILVNLLPLTHETENILDSSLFEKLPDGAGLINVARGQHLVDDDLLAALDRGKLSRAVLDVFRQEPLAKDHPFWDHARIIMTAHVAAQTIPKTGAQAVADNLAMIGRGQSPAAEIDPARGY